jgi:hypothetical protein
MSENCLRFRDHASTSQRRKQAAQVVGGGGAASSCAHEHLHDQHCVGVLLQLRQRHHGVVVLQARLAMAEGLPASVASQYLLTRTDVT